MPGKPKDDTPRFGQRRRPQAPRAPARPSLPISQTAVQFGYKAKDQRAWLAASTHWPDLPPEQWKATRVLGAGGHGICGLWVRVPGAPAWPGPNEVVVKQVPRSKATELKFESICLKRIKNSTSASGGTKHIVDIYKEQFLDPGAGTNKDYDPSPYSILPPLNHVLDVARIYLEYCPGGDLFHKFRELPFMQPWSEEELWRLLGCLVRAAVVMDVGTEHPVPVANQWAGPPIAHFDLKPENILIGDSLDRVGQPHHRLHSFKIADFGLALPVAANTNMDPLWIPRSEWRATPGWPAPEQLAGHSEQSLIGRSSNIWGIGMIMHAIMVWQGRRNPLSGLFTGAQPIPQVPGIPEQPYDYTFETFNAETPSITQPPTVFEAFGRNLLDTPYSKHLIQLIHKCLAYYPSERLTSQQVLSYVNVMLPVFDTLNVGNNGPIQLGQDPINAALVAFPRYSAADVATFDEIDEYDVPRRVKISMGGGRPRNPPDPPELNVVMPFLPPVRVREPPPLRGPWWVAETNARGGPRRSGRNA